MAVVAKVVCILVAFMVVAAPAAEATIHCLTSSLNDYCKNYLSGGALDPSPYCCRSVYSLNAMAETPQDRQAACGCLKNFLHSLPWILVPNADALPKKCGFTLPYRISPDTDCSKVH